MHAVPASRLGEGHSMFISSTSMAAMPIGRLEGREVPCDIEAVLAFTRLVRRWERE